MPRIWVLCRPWVCVGLWGLVGVGCLGRRSPSRWSVELAGGLVVAPRQLFPEYPGEGRPGEVVGWLVVRRGEQDHSRSWVDEVVSLVWVVRLCSSSRSGRCLRGRRRPWLVNLSVGVALYSFLWVLGPGLVGYRRIGPASLLSLVLWEGAWSWIRRFLFGARRVR